MTIGNRLRKWRKDSKIPVREIIDNTGISSGALSNYETDKREISTNFLLKLKEKYDADIYYILTGVRIDKPIISDPEKEIISIMEELSEKEQWKAVGIIENYRNNIRAEENNQLEISSESRTG